MIEIPKFILQGGGIAAAFAVVVGAWSYIATGWRYFVGIFIGTTILKDDAGQAAMAYAFTRGIHSPLGKRVFGGYECYVHPKRWTESVAYESVNSDPVLIKYNKQYALLSLSSGNGNTSTYDVGEYDSRSGLISIKYFRWFFNVESFVNDAIEYYNSEKRQQKGDKKLNCISRFKIVRYAGISSGNKQQETLSKDSSNSVPASITMNDDSRNMKMIMLGVFKLLKWSREDLQIKPEEGQSPFTGYPFPDEVGEAIKELNGWLTNEKWFRSKSIPWRRGWLLYGTPGTGKSTLTRALGMSFDLPVYIFDLSGMTNNDLVDSWEAMMSNTPCIALIEDIDAIFNGREYIGAKNVNISHLTFDCLLNCISGVKQADGVFLIVTTNHIDKLDPALGVPDSNGKSSRPGRIDKAINLGLMAEPQRKLLAQHILSDYPELIDETTLLGEGETAAQFQNRCATLALEKFWNDEKFLTKVKEYNEVMHFDSTNDKFEKQVGLLGDQSKLIAEFFPHKME
jgi:hypothetical protein